MHSENDRVETLATGIKGFDVMMGGGIPAGRIILVTGSAGTGKTVLLNEFLYRGITSCDQNGVFVTFEETPSDIMKNVGNFGWDYRRMQEEGKLSFVDCSPDARSTEEISTDYDLAPLLLRIKEAIRKTGADRIVIDSISTLFTQFSSEGAVRNIIYRICDELKKQGITGMLSAEQPAGGNTLSRYGVEEFVADGVIQLKLEAGEQAMTRSMCPIKMRGMGYRSGTVQFTVDSEGLRVYPKIAATTEHARTSFDNKKSIGIPGLDRMLGGGIPQGHMILMSGNTGSGKTLTCMQYLRKGITDGEKGIYVALEEAVPQLKKTAQEHGWDFEEREKEGNLTFITVDLIDIFPDKLLAEIVEAVKRTGAKRVVLDSISSIMSANMNTEKVRQFLIQLTSYLKSEGVTCMFTYLMSDNFGAGQGQLLGSLQTNVMRLSSIVDGVILLQYVEREKKVGKLLTVLKMRGCNHSRDIVPFEIETGGLRIEREDN